MSEVDEDYEKFGGDPKIPILKYVESILDETQADCLCLPGAIVLLRRMTEKNPDLVLSVNNIHRMVFFILLIASKFIEDIPRSNQLFPFGSGFKAESIFEIEPEFLAILDYDSSLTKEQLEEVLASWGMKLDHQTINRF
jgi:hypothetical protein